MILARMTDLIGVLGIFATVICGFIYVAYAFDRSQYERKYEGRAFAAVFIALGLIIVFVLVGMVGQSAECRDNGGRLSSNGGDCLDRDAFVND